MPLSDGTYDYQYYNAKAVADSGGAILTEEKDLTMEGLLSAIDRFMEHPEELRKMEKAAYEAAPRNATGIVYENIRARLDGAGK